MAALPVVVQCIATGSTVCRASQELRPSTASGWHWRQWPGRRSPGPGRLTGSGLGVARAVLPLVLKTTTTVYSLYFKVLVTRSS
jgi:hypothetical protein